jgi:hypothetical protein
MCCINISGTLRANWFVWDGLDEVYELCGPTQDGTEIEAEGEVVVLSHQFFETLLEIVLQRLNETTNGCL